MGQQLAVRLGREQANVIVNYRRDTDAADRTVTEVEAAGGTALAVRADIAQTEDVDRWWRPPPSTTGRSTWSWRTRRRARSSRFRHPRPARREDDGLTIRASSTSSARARPPGAGGRIVAVSGWDSFRMFPDTACWARRRPRWRRWSVPRRRTRSATGSPPWASARGRSTPTRSGSTRVRTGRSTGGNGWG